MHKESYKGVLTYLVILGRTYYENRAYSVADENFVYDISETMGIYDEDEVRRLIEVMCAYKLFDEEIYRQHNTLTSAAMQRRFCDEQVARRRSKIEIPEAFCLDNEYIMKSREKLVKKLLKVQERKGGNSQQNAENKPTNAENNNDIAENRTENAAKRGVSSFTEERRGEENIYIDRDIKDNDCSSYSSCAAVVEATGKRSQKKEKKEKILGLRFYSGIVYSDEVTNEEYFAIVRRMMRRGAARPCAEADEFISRWSANGWRGRYGELTDKVKASNQWKVSSDRKIAHNSSPWMSVQYREQIDEWLRLSAAVGLQPEEIDVFRGIEKDGNKLRIIISRIDIYKPLDADLSAHACTLRQMYGNDLEVEYKIFKP